MKIGITYDLKEDWGHKQGDPFDANAEFDKPETVDRVIKAFEDGGHRVKRIGNVYQLLKKIDQLDVDIVFNMCEGRVGRNREMQVPVLLEMFDIPFVGADALTLGLTLDKVVTKKIFVSENMPTARCCAVTENQDLDEASLNKLLQKHQLNFPLMVKTSYEGSSKGITQDSRVEDGISLLRQIKWVHDNYHQTALVEEFIRGTEFTVAVLGNEGAQGMPVLQYAMDGKLDLGDEIYTAQRLADLSVEYICPAKISNEQAQQLKDLAVEAYRAVGCRDFGRVDFRVDEKGTPFILEVNPLPSLEVNDCIDLFPPVIGSTFEKTMNDIVSFAVKRYQQKREMFSLTGTKL